MSFKTLFATIAKRDLDYERVDIVTAFLNSLLREDVYVEAPEAYREEGYVWFLKPAIYGLKQSPREWDSTIKKWLLSQDFHNINADHSVFVNRKKRLIITTYVDNLLIVGPKGIQDMHLAPLLTDEECRISRLLFSTADCNVDPQEIFVLRNNGPVHTDPSARAHRFTRLRLHDCGDLHG
jgi:hypothetical protein